MGKLNIGPMDMAELLDRVNLSLAKYKRPLRTLELQDKDIQFKIDDLATLKTMLADFKAKLSAASSAFNPVFNTTSSDTSVLSVVSSKDTLNLNAGTHIIDVTQLAQAQSSASDATKAVDKNHLLDAETITITMGSEHFDINISATDTLQNVVNKINSASGNVGVAASTVSTDGINYQLVLTSKETGAAHSFTVSESLGSPQFNFDFGNNIYDAQDAEFKLDNQFVMTRPTNHVSDAIDGIDIQLLKIGQSTVSITKDDNKSSAAVKTAVQNIFDSYNKLMLLIDKIQSNALYDPIVTYVDENDKNSLTNKHIESVMLTTNDPAIGRIKGMLEKVMKSEFGGSGPYHKLSDLGIMTGKGEEYKALYGEKEISHTGPGVLEFYKGVPGIEALFDNALTQNPSELNKFFNDKTDGVFAKLGKVIDDEIVFGTTGVIDKRLATLTSEKKHLSDKIELKKFDIEETRLNLVDKYSTLNMMLAQFEYTSKYLEAQFDSFKPGKK